MMTPLFLKVLQFIYLIEFEWVIGQNVLVL